MTITTYVLSLYQQELFEKGKAACDASYDKGELRGAKYIKPKELGEIALNNHGQERLNADQLSEIINASRIAGIQNSAVIVVDSKNGMPADLWKSLASYGFYPLFEET